MFEIGRFGHVLSLTTTATSLLNCHYILIAFEKDIQNAYKFSTVHKVS